MARKPLLLGGRHRPTSCPFAKNHALFHFYALYPNKPQSTVTGKQRLGGTQQISVCAAPAGCCWAGGRELPPQGPPARATAFTGLFSWARTDAGNFSPGLGMSLWFRDIYLPFIIMGKK